VTARTLEKKALFSQLFCDAQNRFPAQVGRKTLLQIAFANVAGASGAELVKLPEQVPAGVANCHPIAMPIF